MDSGNRESQEREQRTRQDIVVEEIPLGRAGFMSAGLGQRTIQHSERRGMEKSGLDSNPPQLPT